MERPKRTGRPLTITKATVDALCDKIAGGLWDNQAAESAGIPVRTFGVWKQRARKAKSGIFFYLRERLDTARAAREGIWLERIAAAVERDWRAAAWLLERSDHTTYGRTGIPMEPPADPQRALAGVVRAAEQGAKDALARR